MSECPAPCAGCTNRCPNVPDPYDPIASTLAFMRAADQLAPEPPVDLPDWQTREFRIGLLSGPKGEVTEYLDAEVADDPVEILDGLIDSIVVEAGTALRYFGPEVTAEAIRIVNESNLAKITGPDGVIKDGTGKVCKPAGWKENHDPGPKLAALLTAHGWNL